MTLSVNTSWIPIVVAALVVVFGMGLFARISAALGRRRAPRVLAMVREALARRLPDEARRLLPSAFYMPLSGRYARGEAAVALGVLTAFEETMGTYRLQATTITEALREALERCYRRGTPVPGRLIGPFVSLLWAIAPVHAPLAKLVRKATERASGEDVEAWDVDSLATAGVTEPVAVRPRVARASRV